MIPAAKKVPFLWTPGAGYDPDAAHRLRVHFPRPREPMGEAWFMGAQRRRFPELAGDLDQLSVDDLQRALTEIASGPASFGRLAEWADWYHYLMPRLMERSHEGCFEDLLEYLMTGFMALYPAGVQEEPYPGFADDVLHTLGRSIMDAACWVGAEIRIGTILHRSNNNPNRVWCWWDASGDFSASMFFCLKYLPHEQVGPWFESVLAIQSPHWRAQVLVWLLGAHSLLTGGASWPSDFETTRAPSISWAWSHCLRSELLDEQRTRANPSARFVSECATDAVLEIAYRYFSEERFVEWLACFDTVPYVRDELTHLPSDFEAMYVNAKRP